MHMSAKNIAVIKSPEKILGVFLGAAVGSGVRKPAQNRFRGNPAKIGLLDFYSWR
jgi:hypothetical protein